MKWRRLISTTRSQLLNLRRQCAVEMRFLHLLFHLHWVIWKKLYDRNTSSHTQLRFFFGVFFSCFDAFLTCFLTLRFQINPLGNVALKFQPLKIGTQLDVWNIGGFLWSVIKKARLRFFMFIFSFILSASWFQNCQHLFLFKLKNN